MAPVIQKIYDDYNRKHGTKFKPLVTGASGKRPAQ
jgi:hypothetical protein